MLSMAFSVIVKTLQTFVFSFTTDADVVRTVVFESITITMLRCDCCPAPIPGTGDAELLPPHAGPWLQRRGGLGKNCAWSRLALSGHHRPHMLT